MSTTEDAESPIRVVVSPSQSSCFAGESMTVVITFTNTRSAQPGPQRNQPYSHKRSAHSVSAVPIARPPTSPRTPRTASPPVPTRSLSDGDALRRKGLVGRGKTGISIQTSDLKLGRGPNRSLSLDISAQNTDGMISSPSEGSLTKAPLHVQRALSANGSGSTPPRVPSPLARSASLPLSPKHPHARKMSVLDAHFPSQDITPPVTPSTITSSASTSSYSLSLDPISESPQPSSPAVTLGTSLHTDTVTSPKLSQTNASGPTSLRRPASRSGNHHLGHGPPPSSQTNSTQPPHTATGVYGYFPQNDTQIILYSYVQFVGSTSITPVAGTTDQNQERALNSLRSSLLKRSIIGGGSMDITASLDPNQRKTRSLSRHNRSSSFSSGLISLFSSPSSLLSSGTNPSSPPPQQWVPSHRPVSSMQASRSAPTLSISSSGSFRNGGLGLSFSPSAPEGIVDPEAPLPTYEVQPTMLAVDLSLGPGESRSYTYILPLPSNLPPTFRGRIFRFSYELLVGVCGIGSSSSLSKNSNSRSRVMKVPVRIYNNVTVEKSPSPYDLLWPVAYAQAPTHIAKPSVIEELQMPKNKFSIASPVSTKPGSVDAIREYAKHLLASIPDSDPSRNLDIDSGQEREAGGLTGCREAVEILSRNSKKMSYDVNKDGVPVAVLTFTKSAYRLGETVLCVVDMNERKGRSRVLKLSAILETHESLPSTIARQSNSRLLRRSHAEFHCSLASSTLRMTCSLDIPPDASPAFQIEVNGEPGYLEQRLPAGVAGGLEWKVRLCLLVAVASESTRQGSDGVRLKSFVRDGPRGEWGSSWRGTPVIAPMQYPTHLEDGTSLSGTPMGLRSWASYLASPFLGASPDNYQDGTEAGDYDGGDPIAEGDEGWTAVKVESIECEVPIKVWPGNTAFKAADVVFEITFSLGPPYSRSYDNFIRKDDDLCSADCGPTLSRAAAHLTDSHRTVATRTYEQLAHLGAPSPSMMQQPNNHQQHIPDDSDRQNRFLSTHTASDTPGSRERAASQPPRGTNNDFLSAHHALQGNPSGGASSWLNAQSSQRFSSTLGASSLPGLPQSVPIRSASFSSSPSNRQAYFASAMRETRTFPSTFEDDESEALSDIQDSYDDRYLSSRGRNYGPDVTRSRSQSIATTRPGPVGSGYSGRPASGLGPNWQIDSFSNPLNIPGNRYGDIQPPGNSRYGSFGVGRSPQNIYTSSPSSSATAGNGYSQRQVPDISNVSPFVRDVGQILLDDGSAFRELWAGMHPPRDENGGGGSGSTSRRHSVSVVQPRRPTIVGFNAPGADGGEDNSRSSFYQPYGGSGLLLTDDDLASDLGSLSLGGNDNVNGASNPRSQPSSLPVYAPLSRSPPASDPMSPYQPLNLNIPGNSFASRGAIGSPSEKNILSGGGSPHGFTSGSQTRYTSSIQQQHRNDSVLPPSLTRTFSGSAGISSPSPMSPNGARGQTYLPTPGQVQRGPSDGGATATDLGKGVPLHAVPSHWHLYIIEFKAGRTDLFYSTDIGHEIRVGDLVIVEADRGKDLGKVINDTITLAEVEAFQKQQAAKLGYGEELGVPMSPGASGGSGKKDINPKRIFGKAQSQDIQLLPAKIADEERALDLCRTKARQKKLPMEVIDAEFQWDRRKLTFYFIAEKRIDFRELVRELFRVFKTRIWLSALSSSGGYEQ